LHLQIAFFSKLLFLTAIVNRYLHIAAIAIIATEKEFWSFFWSIYLHLRFTT